MTKNMKWMMLAAAIAATGCESDDGGDDDVSVDASLDATSPEAGADGGVDARAADGGADASADLQRVEIRFRAKIGDEELVCGQTYAGLGTTAVRATPQDFRFFVEQVRLINARGQEVPLVFEERSDVQARQVALIDFADGAGSCGTGRGNTTNMVITGHVPRDSYDGVVIVNGVPASLNNAAPGEAPAPLRAPGAHWGWRDGYRFMMAELLPVTSHGDAGTVDAGGGSHHAGHGGAHDSGSSDAGSPHAVGGGASFVHSGSTGCSGTPGTGITCNTDSFRANRAEIRLPRFNPATQYVVADLGAVFAGVDLAKGASCHGTGASCAPMYMALGIDPATGRPATTQTVFRVE